MNDFNGIVTEYVVNNVVKPYAIGKPVISDPWNEGSSVDTAHNYSAGIVVTYQPPAAELSRLSCFLSRVQSFVCMHIQWYRCALCMHMARFFALVQKNVSGIPGNQLNIFWLEPVLAGFVKILLCRWRAWPGLARRRHGRLPA